MNKKGYKKAVNKCAICKNDIYDVLDVHRIEEGGEYVSRNCVVLCANCHRLHHSGHLTIIDKKYSTGGWVIIYNINGEEQITSV